MGTSKPTVIDLCAVIVSTAQETPHILAVRQPGGPESLPSGPFDSVTHATLEKGLHQWVEEQTGLALNYAEQLYTFGDKFRDPGERDGGSRHVSVGYVALTRPGPLAGGGNAEWIDWYTFFPWEDWRRGKPQMIASDIVPALTKWAQSGKTGSARADRHERVATTFGLTDAGWDVVRVLERYELLYQTRVVAEAWRDGKTDAHKTEARPAMGREMAQDHRRILATAMSRIRGKLTYRPVVFDLLPQTFTLLQLQKTVEALSGTGLHKQNFRRMVITGKLVEPTGDFEQGGTGRPAELYRFRTDVYGEQLSPGVGKFGGR
ncbi:MAG: hypothetical protein O7C63_06950 [Alphaproteobacteria bacterium]|nr:hypothetical protein [Alphaproteobacteria bacterium]MCZ6764653.1 hypothetical protein [Alphaproteobacteria bacterium]